tara:strand:+ start:398 stop:556 length:159 start_codon:yes stop_codon:yes gene_type:complete
MQKNHAETQKEREGIEKWLGGTQQDLAKTQKERAEMQKNHAERQKERLGIEK